MLFEGESKEMKEHHLGLCHFVHAHLMKQDSYFTNEDPGSKVYLELCLPRPEIQSVFSTDDTAC